MRCYEQATTTKLNSHKSKSLTTGGVSQLATALDLGFHDKVTIVGITYGTLGRSLTVGTCLCPDPLPRTATTICTPVSSRENLVSGTNSPTHQRITCNNLQLCAPGSSGKLQSSGHLCPPYNSLKNKAAVPWWT